MATVRLTKTVVEGISPPLRDTYLWDSQLSGFGLKVTPSGSRIYLVQYRPKGSVKTRRYNLGRHGAPHTTESARSAAATLLARIRIGEDPFEVDQRRRRDEAATALAHEAAAEEAARSAFRLVVIEYIEKYAKRRNRSWLETERMLTSKDLANWSHRAVGSITQRDVLRCVDTVSERSPATARLLFAHLRKFFSWCVERLYLETSPCVGLRGPPPSKARDRVLSDREIATIWRAAVQLKSPFASLIQILLLTGQRREEVTGMRWSELDLVNAEWLIPSHRTKNGKAHAVDLSDPAVAILTAMRDRLQSCRLTKRQAAERSAALVLGDPTVPDFVFTTTSQTSVSGHSKIKVRLDELVRAQANSEGQSVPPPWRVHDLRRTAATGMASLGYNPHVVEAVLNHSSGARGGLVAVYQHYDQRSERRAALQAWGDHVSMIVGGSRNKPELRADPLTK